MDFNLTRYEDGFSLLTSDSAHNNTPLFPCNVKDLDPTYSERYVSEDVSMAGESLSFNNLKIPNNFETAPDADDILRNGILVETSKGVVCMSLKDALSSNLNLSVDDFKNVAAQLLSQEIPVHSNDQGQIENKIKLEVNNSISAEPDSTGLQPVLPPDIEMKCEIIPPAPVPKILILPRVVGISRPNAHFEFPQQAAIQNSVLLNNIQSNEMILNNLNSSMISDPLQSSSTLTSETVDTSEENEKNKIVITTKRRGGWPKGRKRKPELLNLPPKAPKTSYNIYLNERRKLYKDQLAFHEITRVVGNQWSNLTRGEKRPYVERAEEDKKRYREELRIYRQSDAYKLYLARKRKKRAMDNLMSESDMDGTDDIDDEDNDMLYCDTCDQWFYNLHNKREHLLSRQHKMTVAGDMTRNLASSDYETKDNVSSVCFSTSLDESSMDGTPIETDSSIYSKQSSPVLETENVYDNMVRLIASVSKREKEIRVLDSRLQESISQQNSYVSELNTVKDTSNALKGKLSELKKRELDLQQQFFRLWNVPSLFVMKNIEYVNVDIV